jgi:hypothetical protein
MAAHGLRRQATHQLTALVDDVNRFPESNEANNSTSANFKRRSSRRRWAILTESTSIRPTRRAIHRLRSWLRSARRWVRIEWKAERGYSLYDPVIAAYRAAGLRVLLLVDYFERAAQAGVECRRRRLAKLFAWIHREGARARRALWRRRGRLGDLERADLFARSQDTIPACRGSDFGAMLRDAVSAIRPLSSRPIVAGGLGRDTSYLTQCACRGRRAHHRCDRDASLRDSRAGRLPYTYVGLRATWTTCSIATDVRSPALGHRDRHQRARKAEPTICRTCISSARDRYGASVPWCSGSAGATAWFSIRSGRSQRERRSRRTHVSVASLRSRLAANG